MSQLTFDYGIHSDLPVRTETPASIGSKFLQTLDALSDVDPTVFVDWQVMDYSQKQHPSTVAAARPRIAAIIGNNVSHDDLGEPNPDWGGYRASAFTDTESWSRHISLRIVTGAKRKGEIWLSTGDYKTFPDQAIVTYQLFKAAMLAISAIWQPLWACAYVFRLDYDEVPLFPGAALFPSSRFHIPWIAYLSPALTVRLALSSDVLTDRTPDGGLLMAVTENRLDPNNPDHWRRARILAGTYSSPAPATNLAGGDGASVRSSDMNKHVFRLTIDHRLPRGRGESGPGSWQAPHPRVCSGNKRQTLSANYFVTIAFEAGLKSFTYQCRRAPHERGPI